MASSPHPYNVRTLQIEVTTECNFTCEMCLHANTHDNDTGVSTELPRQSMEPALFEKLAQEVFPRLDRIILYGVGEPLMHPEFLSLLSTARQYLPEHARIEFTTNGSLLTPAMLEAMRATRLHRIIVSLESPSTETNTALRSGFSSEVIDNLKFLCQGQGHAQEIAMETVVSQTNLDDLPSLVQYCHDIGMPNLFVSHLHPFTRSMEPQALYVPVSQRAFQILMDIAQSGWDTLSPVQLIPMYTKKIDAQTHPQVRYVLHLLDKARQEGIDVDLRKLKTLSQRAPRIKRTQEVFSEARRLAEALDINLMLPPVFVNPGTRQCPFIAQQALFVTVDGSIAPCYNLAHSHSVYINRHLRNESSYTMGSISQSTGLDAICASHASLFSTLQSMEENVPWCGDCIYSTQNCYYVDNNESDCLGNQPGCNECLYSAGFVRCLFD